MSCCDWSPGRQCNSHKPCRVQPWPSEHRDPALSESSQATGCHPPQRCRVCEPPKNQENQGSVTYSISVDSFSDRTNADGAPCLDIKCTWHSVIDLEELVDSLHIRNPDRLSNKRVPKRSDISRLILANLTIFAAPVRLGAPSSATTSCHSYHLDGSFVTITLIIRSGVTEDHENSIRCTCSMLFSSPFHDGQSLLKAPAETRPRFHPWPLGIR
jgi:hypothetical protein